MRQRYTRHQLSNEDYHGMEGISSSHLKLIHNKSLRHYRYSQTQPPKKKDAFVIGSIIHALVLEPETVANDFVIEPKVNKRTKAGKAELAEFEKAHEGKTFISQKDYMHALMSADSILKHPKARALLTGGVAEETIIYKDEFSGNTFKCRADYLHEGRLIVDLKSAADISERKFRYAIRDYGYDIQSGFYCDSWDVADFIMIVFEKEPPYDVVIYSMSKDFIEIGRQKYQAALAALEAAQSSRKWTGFSSDIITLEPQQWELSA